MKLLGIGISDYKEILTLGTAVILISRPRRFGKTLNLSMLKYFFGKTGQEEHVLCV